MRLPLNLPEGMSPRRRDSMETGIYASTVEESAIIERVARIVSSVRGTKSDYTRLAAELVQAVPFDLFGVVLLHHDRKAVRVTVCQRIDDKWYANYQQLPLEESMFRQVLETPLLTVRNYPSGLDGLPSTCGDALSGHPRLRSTLIAPFVVEDRVLGTLELGSTAAEIYDDENLQRLVKAVVQVLANAIDSAQVGGRAEIQDRQRQALRAVTDALATKTELSTILNQIVVGITSSLNVASAKVASAIFMYDRREKKLCLQAQSGLDLELASKVFDPCLPVSSHCIIGQTLRERESIVSFDIAIDSRFPENSAFFTELGMHSVLSYPLVTGTTAYGALLLFSPEQGGFTPLKREILSLFASQAMVAIHNGLLLEAAQQRSRLQEAIERLERERSQEDQIQEELKLLEHVRRETRRVFGVSFTTLLRYVSDNLPTQNERDLQASLDTDQSLVARNAAGPDLSSVYDMQLQDRQKQGARNVALLTKTAEAALESAGGAGELSRLLLQFKQSTTWVSDAWFVLDLSGCCTYMNLAAESLCGMRLDAMTAYQTQILLSAQKHAKSQPVEHLFGKLLPRMRNMQEVQVYLQDFAQGCIGRHELRCVLAVEAVYPQSASLQSATGEAHSLQVESAPSDHHYQLTRYPLYNAEGKLVMHALQVHDATEQVRDEKNQSALLSAVSHDLRTPLTIIKGAVTGLLQHDVAWSEQDRQAMLEDINTEADHLTVLVHALVEMSRIAMGALVLEREWCDVREIVYGAIAKMKHEGDGQSICVQMEATSLPLIYVDHVQLERVMCNLIENAIRHAPVDKEILVHLGITEDGEMLRVQVIDHGPGIPISERERIFKSFYSLRAYGNGLGLAICKGIIDAHHGHIWMDVTTTEGACVVFTLPIRPHIYSGEEAIGGGVGESVSSLVRWATGEK